jgi:prophage tail gpP-like protein
VPVQFNCILTETPYEIIERVARYAGVLAYENANGDLALADVGTGQHSSGFGQGVNVENAAVVFSMDERYSNYRPTLFSTNIFGDSGSGLQTFVDVKDQGVSRFRQLIIVSEQPVPGGFLAQQRAKWEAARRYGRSQAIRVTVDSWRDSSGTLWQPNFYAPVDLPALKIEASAGPFVIGEVNYLVDQDRGTVAELLLMPKQAFLPEPIILRPDPWNPAAVSPGSGGAATE